MNPMLSAANSLTYQRTVNAMYLCMSARKQLATVTSIPANLKLTLKVADVVKIPSGQQCRIGL